MERDGIGFRDDLHREPERAVKPGFPGPVHRDQGLRAARVDLVARLALLAARLAGLEDSVEALVRQVLLELLRLERDRGALAAVADHGEPRRNDIRPDRPGRPRAGRRSAFRRKRKRERTLTIRGSTRGTGSRGKCSPTRARPRAPSRGRMEAGRLDPEIVRGRAKRRARQKDQRRDCASWRCRERPSSRSSPWTAKNPASLSVQIPAERITPTREPEKSAFLWRTAAAPATPEGSTSTFILSSIQHSVSTISRIRAGSPTVSCTIGNVSFPGLPTCRPSAIVGDRDRDPLAFAKESAVSLAVSGSTPKT